MALHTIEDSSPMTALKCNLCGRLLLIFFAMFAAQAVGSAFNIKYNVVQISPLLTGAQQVSFHEAINLYNMIAYPILVAIWGGVLFGLRVPSNDPATHSRQQRRVIMLPWIATILAAAGWLLCIPALFRGLHFSQEEINPHVFFHFPVSVIISMMIALAIGYFIIDWLRQALLFPLYFQEISPSKVRGAFALSVKGRGIVWIIAASICPIVALLLLLISPSPDSRNINFALLVAGFGILVAIFSAALLGRLIAKPLDQLRVAAQTIGKGDLDVRIDNLRADEFGILADEFNLMVNGLREKERIRSTFGRHVGREIAEQLLKSEADLEGVDRHVSVLFADIRGFTTRCENLLPKEAVLLLNTYHAHMTEIIETHDGIVNQLVGDGMMAIFGATGHSKAYASNAVNAGTAMLESLHELGEKLALYQFDPIRIGVGINTGNTVVGTIGSPRRMEYTAIGDTVNTAARIESMTKELGYPLLLSESTRSALTEDIAVEALPPSLIRGRKEPIVLYGVKLPTVSPAE
ncbi:MAG: adenylate/guanylate cyclase domain-containing protein [Verrucomicrobiales bacterium]|nr:adenylate/guanylate cyclase domain-containing protein [Verrucomicrobiales bacterium]